MNHLPYLRPRMGEVTKKAITQRGLITAYLAVHWYMAVVKRFFLADEDHILGLGRSLHNIFN